MKRIHLHTARVAAGLSQMALAARAGVNQKTISRLELDAAARPAFATQTRIARALGIPPESLIFGMPSEERSLRRA
jgi:transcriptional regulator with XRE-family HTH domain